MAAVALAALIAVGVHYNNRINSLSMQVNDLRSQLYNVQNNLSNQIAGISNNVSDILARESSLISQYSYEVKSVNLKKQECTLAFSLLPKTISENTIVNIGVIDRSSSSPLSSVGPSVYNVPLTQDGFGYLHGSVTVPLSDELGVNVNFMTNGETQSQELDTISNLKSQYQPQLKSFLSPISYERQAAANGSTSSRRAMPASRSAPSRSARCPMCPSAVRVLNTRAPISCSGACSSKHRTAMAAPSPMSAMTAPKPWAHPS